MENLNQTSNLNFNLGLASLGEATTLLKALKGPNGKLRASIEQIQAAKYVQKPLITYNSIL